LCTPPPIVVPPPSLLGWNTTTRTNPYPP
jgi:hypothetical protein